MAQLARHSLLPMAIGTSATGKSVLITGSSKGVGHFAVQIAKAYGAKVTAVCYKNKQFVKSLGADQIIAYDIENIHQLDAKFNQVIVMVIFIIKTTNG